MKWISWSLVVLLSLAVAYLGLEVGSDKKVSAVVELNEELFRQKLASPAPEWMLRQIRKDLAPFARQGIRSQAVNENFQGARSKKYSLTRFTLKDGILNVSADSRRLGHSSFQKLWGAIDQLQRLTPLPDVDFLVSSMDGFETNEGGFSCPVFVFSKVENLFPFVLMPDKEALKGYKGLGGEILEASRRVPWDRKKAEVFWRGGPNGTPLTLQNWDQTPRVKLALLSLAMPKEINARLTHFRKRTPPEVNNLLKSKGLMGKWVDKKDHLKYKYLIDIDGMSCTFERLFWLLTSNSLVFKQITPNIQWYYGALVPYRHFVPVKEDLSDLVEQIQWVKEHDEEAKKIVENANAFVSSHLANEDIYLYLYHLIVEYSKLQRL